VPKSMKKAIHSFKFWLLTVVTACLVWLRMQLKSTSMVFRAVDELVKYIGAVLSMNHMAFEPAYLQHPKPSVNGSRRISLVRKPKRK
jgi:hypothetical protein